MRHRGEVAWDQRHPLWRHALEIGKRRVVEASGVLFERGEAARYVFFVLSGRLDVFRNDGKWRVVWSRTSGDVLCFDCAGKRELSCVAAEPTELIAVDRGALVQLAQADAAVAGRLALLHADELRIMLSTLGDAGHMKGREAIDLETRRRWPARSKGNVVSLRRRPAGGQRPAQQQFGALST